MENNEQFKEDLLNVCGNFAKTSLDCIEKQNNELEQLKNKNKEISNFSNEQLLEELSKRLSDKE